MVLAVTFTAIGFAYDAGSGSRELGSVFAACFGLGCVLAVLAVRQASVFTAVIQPPLLLFVAVPGAYFLFHSSEIHGIKDLAINCGYPLIERFPLMFFTSAIVLLIGAARWYLGRTARNAPAAPEQDERPRRKSGGLLGAVSTKVAAATSSKDDAADDDESDDDESDDERPRRRTAERPRRTTKPAAERTRGTRDPDARSAARKPTKRSGTGTSRSRHARPADTEIIEPIADRPRRSRTTRADDAPEPRRRPREPRERDAAREPRRPRERQPRERQPREKLPPLDRRTSYERPEYDRPERDRPERRGRYDEFDDHEPLEPNHHPVSRVRYRGTGDDEERSEYRGRPRARRSYDPDGWEYDV